VSDPFHWDQRPSNPPPQRTDWHLISAQFENVLAGFIFGALFAALISPQIVGAFNRATQVYERCTSR